METKTNSIHTVYIGNLNYRDEEPQILGLFKNYGYIKNIKVMREGRENKSKGFAFVDMVNLNDAKKAIKALDGKLYSGRTLKASLAETQDFVERPKEDRFKPASAGPSRKAVINQLKKEKRVRKKNSGPSFLKSL